MAKLNLTDKTVADCLFYVLMHCYEQKYYLLLLFDSLKNQRSNSFSL